MAHSAHRAAFYDMVMNNAQSSFSGDKNQKQKVPAVSAVLDDGALLELLHDPSKKQTSFVLWNGEDWRRVESHALGTGQELRPYSSTNNLIKNNVVLLPSEPEEYGSESDLVRDIQKFIHRYVDVSPRFEQIAAYYVLFSWLYDNFNELPYLRLRGDYGSGKTRFLLTVGALCYKPIFASGASTISPIFHILNAFGGTLIIDEGDFRLSDEKNDIVKILNNGNVKGIPVLRTEVSKNGEFNPKAFQVFGPKIVATRGYYQDRALESRFITEEIGGHRLRKDIPINLDSAYREEARSLRNKLLLYRFRTFGKKQTHDHLVDATIEPRLNQIFVPLMSIIEDRDLQDELRSVAREYNREIISDRGMDVEAQVLEVIHALSQKSPKQQIAVKGITESFVERFGSDYDRHITAKWVGGILRRKLQIKAHKSHGVFVIPRTEGQTLKRLYEKYGIVGPESMPTSEETEEV